MKRATVSQEEEVTIRLDDIEQRHLLAKKTKLLPENTAKTFEEISSLRQSLGLDKIIAEVKNLDRRQWNLSLKVRNSFDTKRRQSLDDIQQALENATESKDRFTDIKFVIMCIIVSIDIKPPSTPFEPTSLCLADRLRAFLLRENITLSDEAQTPLLVNKDSISIKLKDHPDDGSPIVGIGQAAFVFKVGEVVILQGTVISEPTLTSIQWYKIEDDGTERMLPIDNEKYVGGCEQSPSLVIIESDEDDAGMYMLEATNVNGTSRSTRSQLIMINSGEEVDDIDDNADTDNSNTGNTTHENESTANTNNIDAYDTDASSAEEDTDVANSATTANSTTQNGNSSDSETLPSSPSRVSPSRVNPTQNDVTSSSGEDNRSAIAGIVSQDARTIVEQSGDLVTSSVASDVDTTFSRVRTQYGSEVDEAVDTSDEDHEKMPGVSITKEVTGQPGTTTRDSDDCSR